MWRRACSFVILTSAVFSQTVSEPWPARDLLQPSVLAQAIQSGKPPLILSVGFPVLYKGRHILHAIQAGPGSKLEGLEAMKSALAGVPKDAEIVIYCGCCPMDKCPNIHPAYRAVKELGFTKVRVLSIPTNMHTD